MQTGRLNSINNVNDTHPTHDSCFAGYFSVSSLLSHLNNQLYSHSELSPNPGLVNLVQFLAHSEQEY